MANKVLVSQSNVAQAYSIQTFSGSDSIRIIQFVPQAGQGFTGSVVIEGSYAASPGANSFTQILSATFSGHTSNLTLEVQSNAPSIRARIVTSTAGAIAVFGDSADRTIQGSQGASPATVLVDSPNRVAGSGSQFKINSIVVPSITSDDVVYANDFAYTITDVLDGTSGAVGKQDKIGNGSITANEADVNVLTGTASYGLVQADLTKLADVNTTAAELNRMIGATSNIQDQLNTLATTIPTGFSGLTVSAAQFNAFFNTPVIASLADLNRLDGLTAGSADVNVLTNIAGKVTSTDLEKLGDVTASAAEINALSGFTGTSNDLNRIVGVTASSSDLNTITGLAGNGVSVTQLSFLSGLTQNVNSALNSIPNLGGMTASVNDINTLTGIFAGTGGYANPITATEVSTLAGVTGNIQTQLDNRRRVGVAIGISEISGASITTTELNYLQGLTSNIQSQITAISVNAITATGGSLTGPLYVSDGSVAAPGLGFNNPNQATGFYLIGPNNMGISVNGSQFLALDGVDLQVGVATGGPNLKGVGFGLAAPAYNFTGDEDTGIYRVSADSIGIVAGAERMASFDATANAITIGGNVTSNNSIVLDGIFAGEKVLGRQTFAAGSVTGTAGAKVVYTVPVGRSAIITKVIVRLTGVSNFTNGSLFRFNMGSSVGINDLVDNTSNITIFDPVDYDFNTVGQIVPLGIGANEFAAIAGNSGADYQVLTAASILRGNVSSLAGADTFNFECIAFGYEFIA